jgi:hypothetical protein
MFGSYELTLDSALKLLSDFGFPLEKSESMLTNVRAVDLGVSSDLTRAVNITYDLMDDIGVLVDGIELIKPDLGLCPRLCALHYY